MPQCRVCEKHLSGRSQVYCSNECHDIYWKTARKKGTELPGFTDPDPVINAFLQDFRQLLERHQDAINALAGKRKF